jgi:Tfp pilus assembly protein PilN
LAVTTQPLNGGLRRVLAWGAGVGIQPVGNDLYVVVSRLRPSGVTVAGSTRIVNFTDRPSTEWGAELSAFLRKHGVAHVGAVLLLPRGHVTVRAVPMAGVADADLASAVMFQVDALHPYDETDAVYSWARLPGREAGREEVLVGVAQASVVADLSARFAEAGVKLGSISFSAAAFHTGARLYRTPPEGFLAAAPSADSWELYGESAARPVFTSSYDSTERMLAMARADLRIPADTELVGIERLLPAPTGAPEGFELRANALPYAASLASAAPRLALQANLLPEAQRAGGSAWMYAPTAVLGGLLVIAGGLLAAQNSFQDTQYLKQLNVEIATLEKQAQRAQKLDADAADLRARVALLDGFRRRSSADAEVLREITALIPAPAWVSTLNMNRTGVNLNGESDQAAGLVETLDKSPLFANTALGQLSGQNFSLRMGREGAGTGELEAPKP